MSADELAGCTGKVRFTSMTMARKVAQRRATRGISGDAYRCKSCRGFHIGRPLPRLPRKAIP